MSVERDLWLAISMLQLNNNNKNRFYFQWAHETCSHPYQWILLCVPNICKNWLHLPTPLPGPLFILLQLFVCLSFSSHLLLMQRHTWFHLVFCCHRNLFLKCFFCGQKYPKQWHPTKTIITVKRHKKNYTICFFFYCKFRIDILEMLNHRRCRRRRRFWTSVHDFIGCYSPLWIAFRGFVQRMHKNLY